MASEEDIPDDIPTYNEQRPIIWAFRQFIKNPVNKNPGGRQWKPKAILTALWNLWDERPKEPGQEAYFHAKHHQCIERLRGPSKKHGIDDPLLLQLIKRFLAAYNPRALAPLYSEELGEFVSVFSKIVPKGQMLPDGAQYKPGLFVYELESFWNMAVREKRIHFAIRASMSGGSPACPAMNFSLCADLRVSFGVYCPFSMIAHTLVPFSKGYSSKSYLKSMFWFYANVRDRLCALAGPSATGGSQHQPLLVPPEGSVSSMSWVLDRDIKILRLSPSTSIEAIDFAERTFKELDV